MEQIEVLSASIAKQVLTLTKLHTFVADTENLYTASFAFDEEWDGFVKTVIFRNDAHDKVCFALLDSSNQCEIPVEVVQEGYLTIGIQGNKDGQIIVTKKADGVRIYESGGRMTVQKELFSQSEYDKLMDELAKTRTFTQQQVEIATEAVTIASKAADEAVATGKQLLSDINTLGNTVKNDLVETNETLRDTNEAARATNSTLQDSIAEGKDVNNQIEQNLGTIATKDEVNDINEILGHLTTRVEAYQDITSKYMLNIGHYALTEGKTIKISKEPNPNTNYAYYEIPIPKGRYHISGVSYKGIRLFALADGQLGNILSMYPTTPIDFSDTTIYEHDNIIVDVESENCYLYVNSYGWDANHSGKGSATICIVEKSMELINQEQVDTNALNIEKNRKDIDSLKLNTNVLRGKKWAVCGDSFSNGDFNGSTDDNTIQDGIYKGKNKVYGYLIGNRNNMVIQHLAIGGRTIATPADGSFTNAFSNEIYKSIDLDVDYITLYFGVNDSHHRPNSTGDDGEDKTGVITIGAIDDTDKSTFYGAWNVVLEYLIKNYPFAHIGILVSNGCETDDYRTATIAIANKWGIPYIDLNGDERTPMMNRSTNASISTVARNLRSNQFKVDDSNHHPSAKAHEYESYFIENFLRSL